MLRSRSPMRCRRGAVCLPADQHYGTASEIATHSDWPNTEAGLYYGALRSIPGVYAGHDPMVTATATAPTTDRTDDSDQNGLFRVEAPIVVLLRATRQVFPAVRIDPRNPCDPQ